MAIIVECLNCSFEFSRSASSSKVLCTNCDGSKEIAEKEQNRWKNLSVNEKLDELRSMIIEIQNRGSYPQRLG